MAKYFFLIFALKLAKLSKCQIIPPKRPKYFSKFCQSGDKLPNLVPLSLDERCNFKMIQLIRRLFAD